MQRSVSPVWSRASFVCASWSGQCVNELERLERRRMEVFGENGERVPVEKVEAHLSKVGVVRVDDSG